MDVKKMNTRTAIIESAIQLYFANGFEQTTFAEIAKSCKISQPAIYNHFNNKMDLLITCCEYSAERGREYIDRIVKPEDSASERLQSYLLANLAWFKSEKHYAHMIFALFYFAGSDDSAKKLFESIQSGTLARLRLLLIQGQHESAWKNISVDEMAWQIHSLLIGEVYKASYALNKAQFELSKKLIWQSVNSILQDK